MPELPQSSTPTQDMLPCQVIFKAHTSPELYAKKGGQKKQIVNTLLPHFFLPELSISSTGSQDMLLC